MAEDRNQLYHRIDTLLKYYGIRDEIKLLKYLKAQEQKVQSESSNQPTKS
jgi:hypothetical protein